MGKKPARIGVALCSCGQQLFTQAEWEKQGERLSAALQSGDEGAARLMLHGNLCAPAEQAALARALKSARLDRLVLAGCPPMAREDVRLAVARKAGLPPSAVYLVPAARVQVKGSKARKSRLETIVRDIRRGIAAVARMPSFCVQQVALEQRALVIGAGPAGLSAAAALRELGIPTTVVERGRGAGQAAARLPAAGRLHGAQLLSESRVQGLEGHVGAFTVHLATPKGTRSVKAGAVVVAVGTPPPASGTAPFGCAGVVPLEDLPAAAAALPRRREGRDLAIVLDYALEEGKASSEWALRLALELQAQSGNQVHLLCHDLRVASLPLEELYDQAREAGVDIVKHDGSLALQPSQGGEPGEGLEIRYTDAMLGVPAILACALAGVSRYGVRAAADAGLAELLGLSTDGMGQLQENNLHLAPEATNRPGIFVVGSCRGQQYLPQVQAEARAAALAVHRLLAPGTMEVELSSPTVDPDKCVLCLTCVRACPYKAMVVDNEKKAARSLPEICQRCGICAGECPAKAIELPTWSDGVLLSQLQDVKQ